MSTEGRRLWWLAVLAVSALAAQPANAEIYKWVDKHGTIHFADTPPATLDSGVTVETRSSEPPPPIVRGGPYEVEDDDEAYDDRSAVAYPEPWQQDEPGDEGGVIISGGGEPFVSTPHAHLDRRFGRHEMRHHGSVKTCARQQQVSPALTTVRTQSLNGSAPPFGAPRTVAARSSTRGGR